MDFSEELKLRYARQQQGLSKKLRSDFKENSKLYRSILPPYSEEEDKDILILNNKALEEGYKLLEEENRTLRKELEFFILSKELQDLNAKKLDLEAKIDSLGRPEKFSIKF